MRQAWQSEERRRAEVRPGGQRGAGDCSLLDDGLYAGQPIKQPRRCFSARHIRLVAASKLDMTRRVCSGRPAHPPPPSPSPALPAGLQVLEGKLGMYHDEAGREGGVPSETIEGYLRPLLVRVGWAGGVTGNAQPVLKRRKAAFPTKWQMILPAPPSLLPFIKTPPPLIAAITGTRLGRRNPQRVPQPRPRGGGTMGCYPGASGEIK